MAVAFLDSAAGGITATLSYTVSAGSDRLLVVGVTHEGIITAGGVTCTYGGQSMTNEVSAFVDSGSNDLECIFFTLDDTGIAAASTTTISPSGLAASGKVGISTRSLSGVDQATPVPETNSDSTTSSTPNPLTGIDISAAADTAVCALAGSGSAGTSTWIGVTEGTDLQPVSMTTSYGDDLFGSETVQPRCTFTAQNRAVAISMEISPAVVAGGLIAGSLGLMGMGI